MILMDPDIAKIFSNSHSKSGKYFIEQSAEVFLARRQRSVRLSLPNTADSASIFDIDATAPGARAVFLTLILFLYLVSNGNSHNMMKSGANRRRGKQEIIDAKLAEKQRLRDIEVKMLEHGHMQKQLAEAEEELVEL
jgi:hypothetical protein